MLFRSLTGTPPSIAGLFIIRAFLSIQSVFPASLVTHIPKTHLFCPYILASILQQMLLSGTACKAACSTAKGHALYMHVLSSLPSYPASRLGAAWSFLAISQVPHLSIIPGYPLQKAIPYCCRSCRKSLLPPFCRSNPASACCSRSSADRQ